MKTTRHLLLFLVLLWTAAACDKDKDEDDDDPRPNLAAEVAGNYEISEIVQNGRRTQLPAENRDGDVVSGTITLKEVDEETVNGVIEFLLNGQPNPDSSSRAEIGNISLELEQDSASIALLDGSQQIGTYTKDEVRLTGTADGAEIEIVASK